MKLRIRGDSLRLRLTRGEVDRLVEGGLVSETTSFGDARLIYALRLAHGAGARKLSARLDATAEGSRIEVEVDAGAARAWAAGDAVGIEATDGALLLLVEKDYACLQDRPHEDDTDAFPNPNKTCD
jgi:hypothetical protein